MSCLIRNVNIEDVAVKIYFSLIHKAVCILVSASENELMNTIRQTFPQSMFEVGLFEAYLIKH